MDEALTNNSNPKQVKESTVLLLLKKILRSTKGRIIAGVLLLFIIILSGILLSPAEEKPKDTAETAVTKPTTDGIESVQTTSVTSPDTKTPQPILVYGAWTGQLSLIKAVNLGSSETKILASLPIAIKKVSILSPENLLYLNQTDAQDHGEELAIYAIKEKKVTATIPAEPGFGIDDYVLSPNKQYAAVWEVQFAPNSPVLLGGKSRVYSIDLSRPTVKHLLYDEQSSVTQPIHYPRAILNDGTVFADTFMPNDTQGGTGWAYGMSVVNFDGSNKRNIDTMKAGTYGTQPSLSPDGKYLLFAGYNGSKGDGNALKNGFRQAILTPNTVDVLHTQTLKRYTLANLSASNIYSAADWETQTGKVILTVISSDASKRGVFSYDLIDKTSNKLIVPSADAAEYGYISQLHEGKALIGAQDSSPSNLGNLGDNYQYAFTHLALLDMPSQKVSSVSLQDPFAQYITLLPSNYFGTVLGMKTVAQAIPQPTFVDMYSDQNQEKDNLQLYTFFLKSELSSQRREQQSTPITFSKVLPPGVVIPPDFKQNKNSPTCEQLAEEQCKASGMAEGNDAFEQCVKTNKNHNKVTAKFEGKCHDSPLYLYGQEGKSVHVAIRTPIYNAVPSTAGAYAITLGTDGDMYINNKVYKSIAYDYQPNAKRLIPPSRGKVVTKAEVETVLREYAEKLGLNARETDDIIAAGKKKVTSPYAFVSFFNQEQSEYILPISFSPMPDNYLNVVFYFKLYEQKPSFTPSTPVFPDQVKRSGFTAVEVSEIVE